MGEPGTQGEFRGYGLAEFLRCRVGGKLAPAARREPRAAKPGSVGPGETFVAGSNADFAFLKGIAMYRRRSFFSVLVLASCCLAGCRRGSDLEWPATLKVTGKVTFDGKPVEGAHVTFSSKVKGPPAFGETDAKGEFELSTSWGKGAVAGPYLVTITKEKISGGMAFDSEMAYRAYVREHGEAPPTRSIRDELPQKYKNRKTSGLEAEVLMGKKNYFEFDLKKK